MSDMWHVILSSDCPIYHIFVSTATYGWNMIPLGSGRPRASSGPGSGSLGSVTYLSCGGASPNALAGPPETRHDSTDTGQTMGSGLLRGQSRKCTTLLGVCSACCACCGRAAGRNSYSRSEILAGPDGPVLATRERGLQAEPSSIYDDAEGNCLM